MEAESAASSGKSLPEKEPAKEERIRKKSWVKSGFCAQKTSGFPKDG